MRKNHILILFITILFYVPLLAQLKVNEEDFFITEKPEIEMQKKNQENLLGIDFHLFGTSFHYSKNIKENLFWGFEFGILPDLFDWIIIADRYISEENTLWSGDKSEAHLNSFDQLVFGHLFMRIKPEKHYFEVDAGVRVAVYSRSGSEVDDLGLTNLYGGYVKPVIGNKKFKLGVRVDFGIARGNYYGPINEFIVIASPLIRFNLKKI